MNAKVNNVTGRFFIRLLKILNLILLIILGMSYLAPYIHPGDFWLPALSGLSFTYILAANLFFIVTWFLLKRKFVILPIIIVALGWNHIGRLMRFNPSDGSINPQKIRVLSYNVQNFYHEDHKKFPANVRSVRDSITRFIEHRDPDILCLQEFPIEPKGMKDQLNELTSGLGYKFYHFSSYFEHTKIVSGIALISRYPIILARSVSHDGKAIAVYCDLVTGNDTIRSFNVHLASVNLGRSDYEFISDFRKKATGDEAEESLRGIIAKLKNAFVKRGTEAHIIAGHIAASPYPVIVCGDFNDTPNSYTYRIVSQSLDDAFLEAGRGMASTYAGDVLPSFRIDYLFFDPGYFKALDFNRIKIRMSDHYPIEGDLIIKNRLSPAE